VSVDDDTDPRHRSADSNFRQPLAFIEALGLIWKQWAETSGTVYNVFSDMLARRDETDDGDTTFGISGRASSSQLAIARSLAS
jgi:hypothetical protein